MLEAVINMKSNHVEMITIKPSRIGSSENSLTVNNIEIKNKESIKAICEALNESERTYAGYVKKSEWRAVLEISKQTKK